MLADANADGTSAGLASANVMIPTATVSGVTTAYAGQGADISGTTLTISAETLEYKATAHTVAISVGLGAANVVSATAITTGVVDAHLASASGPAPASAASSINLSGAASITATSVIKAIASADGAGVGGVAIGVMLPTANAGGVTRAYMGEGMSITAASLKIVANGKQLRAEATTQGVNVGAFGAGAGLVASATVSGIVEAFVGAQAGFASSLTPGTINVGSGAVSVDSGSDMTAIAVADSTGLAGLASISVIFPTATVSGITRSYVRDGVDITAGSLRVRVGLDDPLTLPDDPVAAKYTASATSVVVSVGGVASLVLVNADATITGVADAFIGAPTGIAAGGAAGTDLSISGAITVATLSKICLLYTSDAADE